MVGIRMAFELQIVADSAQIGDTMREIVEECYADCIPYVSESLVQFFDRVARIPYCMEENEFQALCRPYYTLNSLTPVTACANKAICMAAYLKCRGLQYRFQIVAKNEGEPLHHVFCEGYIGGRWMPLDATYSNGRIGLSEEWSKVVTK
jgi:hypothetical protein